MASREGPVRDRRPVQTADARAGRGAQAPIQAGRCAGAAAQLAAVHRTLRHGPTAQLEAGGASGTNRTGLPDRLKAGVEALSGISLDSVRVHHNSSKPAQLNALAYAQGRDIHLAPGQERHLPHEAWHVVQQAQGRVKPTMQMRSGVPVNADQALEREADAMGAMALQAALRPMACQPPGAIPPDSPALIQRLLKDWEMRDLKGSATLLKSLLSDARVDQMLENGNEVGLSYGDLYGLVAGLTQWAKFRDTRDYAGSSVAKLARSREEKFVQDYAEIYNAIQRGPEAGLRAGSEFRPGIVVLNAVKGKDYALRPQGVDRIDPVHEADAFFHGYDGKLHLEEVKATPQAFFDKLVTKAEQFENMLIWRDAAPNRVVTVRIHLEKDFAMLDRIERYADLRDKITWLILKGMEITVNGKPVQEFLKLESNPYAMDMPDYGIAKPIDPSTGLARGAMPYIS